MNPTIEELRVPKALREKVERIFAVTDACCVEHLANDYAPLCRKLVGKLARKRPSPLARGDLRIWAAGVICAVGTVNFLTDPSESPHLTHAQLADLLGVSQRTMEHKSRLIRDLLDIGHFDIELCRPSLLARHPTAWLISIDGLIVDARTMPAEIQQEARRLGLIPDLSPTE